MPQDQDRRTITIELNYGSAALADDAFAAKVESCTFPNHQFRHADHIRLAWIYLRRHEYKIAEERMRRTIYQFACHLGAGHKYHETMTIAWMRLVNAALHLSSRLESFRDFAGAHAWLLNKESIFEFYSRNRLLSDTARATWVEPDTRALPSLR